MRIFNITHPRKLVSTLLTTLNHSMKFRMIQSNGCKRVKEHSDCEYAGEIVKYHIADGYAEYMVFSVKPVKLVHIPLYDAYHFPYAHRWTAKDIKDMVKRERAMKELFSGKSIGLS